MHEKGNTNGNLERGESNEVLGQGLACVARSRWLSSQIGCCMLLAFRSSALHSPFAPWLKLLRKHHPKRNSLSRPNWWQSNQRKAADGFIFSEVAEYADITVLRGVWNSGRLRVVHGCTELPRSQYASGAGTLERFTIGDYHRLELTLHDIYKTGRRLKTEDAASAADYFSLRVDLTEEPVEGATCKSGWLGKREVH